jgi:hypothetical protein
MSKENLVSLSITPADLQDIQNAVATLKSKLLPYLLELSTDEKLSIPKMKDKTLAFVTKSYEHAVNHPTLVPAYVDVAEFKKDINAVEQLRQLSTPLDEIAKALDDTMTVAGSEAYVAALSFYNSVKSAAKNNVPGGQVVYEDLKTQFHKTTVKKTESPSAH